MEAILNADEISTEESEEHPCALEGQQADPEPMVDEVEGCEVTLQMLAIVTMMKSIRTMRATIQSRRTPTSHMQ